MASEQTRLLPFQPGIHANNDRVHVLDGGMNDTDCECMLPTQSTMDSTIRTLQSWSNRRNMIWAIGLAITALTALLFALAPSSSQNGVAVPKRMTIANPTERVYWDEYIHEWERNTYELQQKQQQHQSKLTQWVAVPDHLLGKGKHHHHHGKDKDQESSSPTAEKDTYDGSKLIYFNQSKAFDMILEPDDDKKCQKHSTCSTSDDFFYYQQGWEAQMNQAYCGVASSAAIMNSLRGLISLPQDKIYEPFPWATQHQLLNIDCVKADVLTTLDYDYENPPMLWAGLGMPMTQRVLSCNLASQGYTARAVHVDPKYVTVDDVRVLITNALRDPNARVLMNYDRGGIGQGPLGHGHFSPIGAYHAGSDSFLVLDVAKYKYPPVWVPASNLFDGISTWDSCSEFQYPATRPDGIEFAALLDMMNCQPNYRGLIVVYPLSKSSGKEGVPKG